MTEAKTHTDGGAENKAEADGYVGWCERRGRLKAATELAVRALPEAFL